MGAAYSYFYNVPTANFDVHSIAGFRSLHPEASPVWMYFSYIDLASWVGIHPGYLAMYLAFCLVILLTEKYQNKIEHGIHIFIGFIMIAFLVLLATRMAIVAFGCTAIYLLITKNLKPVLLIVSAFLIGIVLVWCNPVARFRLIEEPMDTNYHTVAGITNWNSVSFRLLEWRGSWSVIRAHWFAGVGTGGGTKALDNFYAHHQANSVALGLNAHNQYLQTWMESGLLGIIAFLLCLTVGLFTLRNDPSYVSFILIFSLMCLTESVGERQKGIVFFLLFQVLFLGLVKNDK